MGRIVATMTDINPTFFFSAAFFSASLKKILTALLLGVLLCIALPVLLTLTKRAFTPGLFAAAFFTALTFFFAGVVAFFAFGLVALLAALDLVPAPPPFPAFAVVTFFACEQK